MWTHKERKKKTHHHSLEIVQVSKRYVEKQSKVMYSKMPQKKKLHHSFKQSGPVKSLK